MNFDEMKASRAAQELKDRQEKIETMLTEVLTQVKALRDEVAVLMDSKKKKNVEAN